MAKIKSYLTVYAGDMHGHFMAVRSEEKKSHFCLSVEVVLVRR